MADDDELVVVADTDPDKRRREHINSEVSSLLLTGVLVGMVSCICMFGVLQQFVEQLNEIELVSELARKFWFQIDWWYWLVPLVFCSMLYFYARSAGRRKLLRKE